jgi:hypothetical protein
MTDAIPAVNPLVLIGVGLGLVLVVAAVLVSRLARRLRRGVRVPGVVVDVTESPAPTPSGGTLFHPVIRYLTTDGDLVTTPAALSGTLMPPRRGREVTVLYDPARPKTAGIVGSVWLARLTSAAFMAAGVGVAAASTAVFFGAGS